MKGRRLESWVLVKSWLSFGSTCLDFRFRVRLASLPVEFLTSDASQLRAHHPPEPLCSCRSQETGEMM